MTGRRATRCCWSGGCSTTSIELDGDTGARPLLEGDHVYTWEVGRLCDPTDIDTPERLQEVQS